MINPRINELVSISPTYTSEVDIQADFCRQDVNAQKVQGYIPTEPARIALTRIVQGLMPVSEKRVHLITGMYGTGKSHFGLLLANLFNRSSDDTLLSPFLAKLRDRDSQVADQVERHRNALPGQFLVVLLQPTTDPEGFNHSLLVALHEALKREGLSYLPETRFTHAAALVNSWTNDPEMRPRLERELARLRTDPHRLQLNLQSLHSEDYELFCRVHRLIVHADFRPEHFGVPKEVYQNAVKYLRSSLGMAGIIIIADEFGAYLSDLAKEPSGRAANQIQDFVQFCKRTREEQVHLVLIAHRTLADYAAGHRSREEWAKLAGRFIENEYSLNIVGGQAETIDMIDSVILSRKDTPERDELWQQIERDLQIWQDWVDNLGLFPNQPRIWLQDQLLKGCYPLHPASAYCLPWLAQRAGQANRTTFKFLESSLSGGLGLFITTASVHTDSGSLNLYTPDSLLTYFRAGMEEKPEYRPILMARDAAQATGQHSSLAIRLIDLLAVLEIVQQPALSRTRLILSALVSHTLTEAEEAGQVLDLLLQQRVIRLRRGSGQYELPRRSSGEIDVYDALQMTRERQSRTGSANVFPLIKNRETLPQIAAREYENRYGLPRVASRDLIMAGHLENREPYLQRIRDWYIPGRGTYQGDALILVVLAESQTEIESAKAHLANGTGSDQLIVAVPGLPFAGGEALLDLAAIDFIRSQGLKIEDSTVDPEDLDRAFEDRQAEFDRQWKLYISADNFAWYYGTNVDTTVPSGGEEALVSRILQAVFKKTPVIRDESLTALAGGRRERKSDRLTVMRRLLDKSGLIVLQKSGGQPNERMLRAALKDTELLEKKRDLGQAEEYEVRQDALPNSGLSEIWAYLRTQVTTAETPIRLGQVVGKLFVPPYGLSTPLLEVLLAALLRTVKDQVAIFSNPERAIRSGQSRNLTPVAITAENISKFISEADNYVLWFYEIRPAQKEYIQKLTQRLGVSAGEIPTGGLWDQGKNALLTWYARLPSAATKSNELSDTTRNLTKWLSDSKNLPDGKEMLSVQLPQLLSISIGDSWMAQTTQDTMTAMELVLGELEDVAPKRMRVAQEKLCQIFNATGATLTDLDEAARRWYNSLGDAKREHAYMGETRPLMEAVNSADEPGKRYLVALPMSLMKTYYNDWIDSRDIELFATRIQLLKQQVENWTPTKVVPDTQGKQQTNEVEPQTQPEQQTEKKQTTEAGNQKQYSKIDAAKQTLLTTLQGLRLTPPEQRQVVEAILKELGG